MIRTLFLLLSVFLLLANPSICLADNAQPSQTPVTSQAIVGEGTEVRLKLEEELSTKTANEGQKLQLAAAEDVLGKDGKTIVIKEGAPAIAYLMNADDKSCARGGKLSIDVRSVKAVDGSKILLHGVKSKTGGNGAGAGSYIIGGLFLGVLGLGVVALAGQSKHAKIPEGTIIKAFVEQDTTIAIAPGATDQTVNKSIAVITVSGNVVTADKPDSQVARNYSSVQNKDNSPIQTQTEKPASSKSI